jgi:hypothetical protein
MVLAALALATPAAAAPRPTAPASILLQPAEATLAGPRARQTFIVTATYPDGSQRDLTRQARLTSLDPRRVGIDASGAALPVADGPAQVKAVVAGKTATARLTVRDAQRLVPISFNNQVVPILTHAGCNQGACHGSQYGKGGFKLSLLGYDPDVDYDALVKQDEARRVVLTDPAQSLMLRKPTMALPHGGGLRFKAGSYEYETLAAWLRDGAPGPDPKDPTITGLTVLPPERVTAPGEQQRLVVRAAFSDGTVEDVTNKARLNSLNEGIAVLSDAATVKVISRGETAIMVRYLGRVTIARITAPYRRGAAEARTQNTEFRSQKPVAGSPHAGTGRQSQDSSPPPAGFIDDLVAAKWRRMGLEPSAPCTDAEFIRRVYLDTIGTLPAPDEARAFLAATDPQKRAKLIDQVLDRPEYVDFWTLKWGDLLRNNRERLGEKGMWSFYNWLRAAMRTNKPVDALVRELITAQGSTYSNGAANFYRVASNPTDLAEATSQLFLGIRMQCAKCHHHPYEKWSQQDYYGMAAFFARVGLKRSDDFGIFGQEQIVLLRPGGEVTHPKTGKVVPPRPLDGQELDDPVDRRRALAEWLTSKGNLLFARNIANRFWGYVMGRGIVDPIDDMRVTNPASNPELLDALAKDLVAHGFDQKHLLRTILNSRVYQLSGNATPDNAQDEAFFTHYAVKRMPAEVLLDAINSATGTTEKFTKLPKGTRAIALPDPGIESYFLDTFGRPPRLISCECERTGAPNISQALHLMNGEFIQAKVASPGGRVAKLLASKKSDEEILTEFYLATLSRPPRPEELARVQAAFKQQPPLRKEALYDLPFVALELAALPRGTRFQALGRLKSRVVVPPSRKDRVEDILWALVNSREFVFVH